MASIEKFNDAVKQSTTLKEAPGNDVKLKMYALYKQACIGVCNTKKPGMMDFVGKAKWEAWNSLGTISQEDARTKYVELVSSLQAEEKKPEPSSTSSAVASDEFLVKTDSASGICEITLNRPKKKNAINLKMYENWAKVLNELGNDSTVRLVTITGAGDYFCSGNDLTNFQQSLGSGSSLSEAAESGGETLRHFVKAFINFPKPLIALVNGPAVGISVSTLALYDLVFASSKATFHCPFTALGQSPEGCSSYTFPKIMGLSKANEFLLFGRKWTAEEAHARGLVTQVFPDEKFRQETSEIVQTFAQLPKQSLLLSKKLIRGFMQTKLEKVNDTEVKLLVERWQSEECMNAIMNFLSKHSKM